MYCVYLTVYRGNKLPPFYLGSSSVDRINNGYRGSVQSKKYKQIWNTEIKYNSHLFVTKIISVHSVRQEALDKEYKLQKQLNVVKNIMYINQSLANINGFFGMNKSGMFHKEETKRKMSISHKGKIETEETKRKKSVALIGLIRSKETKLLISKANTGKQRTQEFREKQSIATKGENNPRYGYKYTILEKLQHSLKLKEGYASGKIKSQKGISKHKQEFKEKRSQEMQGEKHHNYGKIWINNGVINKYINSNAPIPESWCKGMMKKN